MGRHPLRDADILPVKKRGWPSPRRQQRLCQGSLASCTTRPIRVRPSRPSRVYGLRKSLPYRMIALATSDRGPEEKQASGRVYQALGRSVAAGEGTAIRVFSRRHQGGGGGGCLTWHIIHLIAICKRVPAIDRRFRARSVPPGRSSRRASSIPARVGSPHADIVHRGSGHAREGRSFGRRYGIGVGRGPRGASLRKSGIFLGDTTLRRSDHSDTSTARAASCRRALLAMALVMGPTGAPSNCVRRPPASGMITSKAA